MSGSGRKDQKNQENEENWEDRGLQEKRDRRLIPIPSLLTKQKHKISEHLLFSHNKKARGRTNSPRRHFVSLFFLLWQPLNSPPGHLARPWKPRRRAPSWRRWPVSARPSRGRSRGLRPVAHSLPSATLPRPRLATPPRPGTGNRLPEGVPRGRASKVETAGRLANSRSRR